MIKMPGIEFECKMLIFFVWSGKRSTYDQLFLKSWLERILLKLTMSAKVLYINIWSFFLGQQSSSLKDLV